VGGRGVPERKKVEGITLGRGERGFSKSHKQGKERGKHQRSKPIAARGKTGSGEGAELGFSGKGRSVGKKPSKRTSLSMRFGVGDFA